MNKVNNLNISVRLMVIFGMAAIIAVSGILYINHKSRQLKAKLHEMYMEKTQIWQHMETAERHLNAAYAEISTALATLSGQSGDAPQQIASANEYMILAKTNLNRFRSAQLPEPVTLSAAYQSLSGRMERFLSNHQKMVSFIHSFENPVITFEYYDTHYTGAYADLSKALKTLNGLKKVSFENGYLAGTESITGIRNGNFIILLSIIFFLVITGYVFEQSLQKPLAEVNQSIRELSRGQLPEKFQHAGKDELGVIKSNLNKYISGLKETVHFARKIGEGNLDVAYTPMSDEDMLGNALLEMRKDLKKARQDEAARKKEDEKRTWANQGHAMFADLLRKDNDDVSKLADELISNLVNYLKANQGGLFIYNEEDDETGPCLELIAAYAFNRKKYLQKKIKLGESLVGTCAIEKETIHLKEIPHNYIEITSGLGDANPNSLLIVPLKLDNEVFGVIELASFNAFEAHQIEFIEKLGESIASTISSVRINAKTKALLNESNQQAEEMATKEEELRQNLEELEATQEALASNEARSKIVFDNVTQGILTMDTGGMIDFFNPAVENLFGYSSQEISGRNVTTIIRPTSTQHASSFIGEFMAAGTGMRFLQATGIKKDGTLFDVEIRIAADKLDNQTIYVAEIRKFDKSLPSGEEHAMESNT